MNKSIVKESLLKGGNSLYIYAEYLILENIIINYIILYVTGRFTRTDTNKIRLSLASLIGALYTLVVFFPSLKFMVNVIVKLAISVLIIIVAYNPSRMYSFLKLFVTFYVVSFAFAGAALALFYFIDIEAFVQGGIFYIKSLPIGKFPLKTLVVAVVLSSILLKFSWGYIQSIMSRDKAFIPISISLNNKVVELMALMDTGNSLKDPISDTPVIVAEFYAIKELLPKNVQNIFLKYSENNLEIITDIMSKATQDIKFRLIPFKSLGSENGMMLGFKPDNVILKDEDEKILSNIVVGIYNNTLSSDNKYMALLHPEILK